MKIFGLIALFIIISVIDLPSMVRKTAGKFKYIAVYSFIYIISFIISLLQVIEKAPISPAKVIHTIVKGIMGDM